MQGMTSVTMALQTVQSYGFASNVLRNVVSKYPSRSFRTSCFHLSRKDIKKNIKPPGFFKSYVINKYIKYMEWVLEKRLPAVYKVYSIFKGGVVDLFGDIKVYYNVSTDLMLKRKTFPDFSRKELETYRQIPKDMWKMIPFLLLTSIPIVNYAVYPIAYMYPRQLLCKQFWTNEQFEKFSLHFHKHNLKHYPPIFQKFKEYVDRVPDPVLRGPWEDIIEQIESNNQPDVNEMIEYKAIFNHKPLVFSRLSQNHVRHIGSSLGMARTRHKLSQDTLLLQHIDRALLAEGLEELDEREINNACFQRGLNPLSLTTEEKLSYLTSWLNISRQCSADSMSLLLHSHVLLTYNHPTNTLYMPRKTQKNLSLPPKQKLIED